MDKFKCNECDNEYNSLKGLSQHRSRQHGISAENTYIEYKLDGKKPTCKCGCGDYPKLKQSIYCLGHQSVGKAPWNKGRTVFYS